MKSFIVHRDWSAETVQNDIALLNLSKNVTFSSSVEAVNLPSGTDDYVGQVAVLIGWGLTENGAVSDSLKGVNSSVISNEECNRVFGVSIS